MATESTNSKVYEAKAKAVSSYTPKKNSEREELALKKGDIVVVLVTDDGNGWMKGTKDGVTGWFPKKCVKDVTNPDGVDAAPLNSKQTMETLDKWIPNRPSPEELENKGVLQKKSSGIFKSLAFWKKKPSSTQLGASASSKNNDKGEEKHGSGDSDSGDGDSNKKKQLKKERKDSKQHEKKKKKKKKKRSSKEEEVDENATIYASCFQQLPDDLQKKIEKCKIEEEKVNQNFEIMCNVLRFTTKRNIIISPEEEEKRKKEREKGSSADSNLRPELLQAAEGSISYSNPKKLYKATEMAGKGGFGSVYYAKSVKEKTQVAIKKMPHNSPKEKRMNLDEIAVLYFCNHPNIVKYYKSFICDGEANVVMEFLEGGSLSEAIRMYPFKENHVAYVAREMLQGIKYLHDNNLVHRDLKSANVMMSTHGDVKLIDFGLTVDISKCKVHMVGSPFWMPPEMIRCEPHGYSSDIWSFAICMIEMVDKKPPNRKTRIKAMFNNATEGLLSYVEKREKYSTAFKEFLSMCLHLEPEKRATPAQLLDHPFLKGASTKKEMEKILRDVFLSSTFENSGFSPF